MPQNNRTYTSDPVLTIVLLNSDISLFENIVYISKSDLIGLHTVSTLIETVFHSVILFA